MACHLRVESHPPTHAHPSCRIDLLSNTDLSSSFPHFIGTRKRFHRLQITDSSHLVSDVNQSPTTTACLVYKQACISLSVRIIHGVEPFKGHLIGNSSLAVRIVVS